MILLQLIIIIIAIVTLAIITLTIIQISKLHDQAHLLKLKRHTDAKNGHKHNKKKQQHESN